MICLYGGIKMKTAYINGILLDGTADMTPQEDLVVLTDDDTIEDIEFRDNVDLSGYRIVDLVRNGVKPSSFLTRESFINAIKVAMSVGGSTNCLLHIPAIAHAAEVDVTIDAFDRLSREVPQLISLRPGGEYMMEDFDDLCGRALSDYPLYERIVSDKIDGMQNIEIQADIEEQFEVKHSLEYISSLWRKKIPKIIASQAEDDTLNWYFLNKEKGKYKRCSRCGEIKLAHNKYFSKNKTSKDGFYSICKKCRNKKDKK